MKRVSEDAENLSPLQEIKGFFEWVNSQADETPFKAIKLATGQFLFKIDKLEKSLKNRENEEKYKKILEEIRLKNENLTESLGQLENELKSKSEGIRVLQEQINKMNEEAVFKENESKDSFFGSNHEFTIAQNKDKHVVEAKIGELEAEIEEKNYYAKVLETENKKLTQRNEQNEAATKVYIQTIEELKGKLKKMRIESVHQNSHKKENETRGFSIETVEIPQNRIKTSEKLRIFDDKSHKISENNQKNLETNGLDHTSIKNFEKRSHPRTRTSINAQTRETATQTFPLPKHSKKRSFDVCKISRVEDFISYNACMASALEALLNC